MTTASEFRAIAMSLPDTTEAPHFDRAAFKVKRIYATLAADGLTANLKLTPDEQEFKAMMAPEAFFAIDNGWGRQGWTTVVLRRRTAGGAHDGACTCNPYQRSLNMRRLGCVCFALWLVPLSAVQAGDASEAETCKAAETLVTLPAGYVEDGHTTLLDGSHVYFYESDACRCSDDSRNEPDGTKRYFRCNPITPD